jgi:proline iminopeptidase
MDNSFYLTVDNIHQIFVGVHGNPDGNPVVVLHGGPGSGGSAKFAEFFDLDKFFVIIPDQRGAGKSIPQGELVNNTTQLLIDDIEAIRRRLNIEQWHVFGGSWGSTLALAYAINHQPQIKSLLIRGLFMASAREMNYFFEGQGANELSPLLWQTFSAPVSHEQSHIDFYYDNIVVNPSSTRQQLLANWHNWSFLNNETDLVRATTLTSAQVSRAMIMLHYLKHRCFFEPELLTQCQQLSIPIALVQGKQDLICPVTTAVEFANQIKACQLFLIDGAGHDPFAPSMVKPQLDIIAQW